ncbi:MAG: glycosyltransferase [Acidobacteria bacterium]|nr:glycosyltransferase [Acidobacteriota bacterium]
MRRILFIQYTNPAVYPPLEHSSRILADRGWQALFLGTGSLGADSLRFKSHERIEVRQMSFSPAGWRQKLHYARFVLWTLWWTLRWKPEWTYASDLLSCPVAMLSNILSGARVIYHEHDSPPPSKESIFKKLNFEARRRLAHRAELCVLPNQQRAERFVADVNKSVNNSRQAPVVVWNCPSVEDVTPPRPAHDGGDLWVLYAGSIVPSRMPVSVLEALAKSPERLKLRVIGYETIGHRGYVNTLLETGKQLGISSRVEYLGTLPERNELLSWCRKCDVGLALMPKESEDINEQAMAGASNKPFDYLSCGLALLVSDLPDWRTMYVETGYGLTCDPGDSESIATALRWFMDHPVEMRVMGEHGRQRIATDWNYEIKFSPVLERMSGYGSNEAGSRS